MDARQGNFAEVEEAGKGMKEAGHYAVADIEDTVSCGRCILCFLYIAVLLRYMAVQR